MSWHIGSVHDRPTVIIDVGPHDLVPLRRPFGGKRIGRKVEKSAPPPAQGQRERNRRRKRQGGAA